MQLAARYLPPPADPDIAGPGPCRALASSTTGEATAQPPRPSTWAAGGGDPINELRAQAGASRWS